MTCCFSGEEVPTEKLFVLYYPPSMAHHGWDQSVYAAAHAKHVLAAAVDGLQTFHGRYVIGKNLWLGVAIAVAGLALFAIWLAASVPDSVRSSDQPAISPRSPTSRSFSSASA
jgi:hypothetical protein